MNKILVSTLLFSLTFTSCKMLKSGRSSNNNDGQITSKSSTTWTPIRPKGMVPVPGGSFVLGQSDYDFTQNNDAPVKTVSVAGFFMDDTEITNSEYKIFVDYVRDSITRTALADKAESLGFDPLNPGSDRDGIGAYAYISGSKDGEGTPYDEYIQQANTGRDGNTYKDRKLNWDVKIEWNKYQYPDLEYTEVMESLYFPPEERMNGVRRFDTRNLDYTYVVIDQVAAAKKRGTFQVDFRKEFLVNVYPDTTVWIRDFEYSYNDPMHQDYFWHSAYADYPVVGINWNQANAFCDFRTKYHNNALSRKKKKNGLTNKVLGYRLPTEIEWEYAARGGIQDAPYPWGGPYLMDSRGCYLANFKPKRGDYMEIVKGRKTGYMYTAPVKTFPANGYGLYDMAGNVAEWTVSPFNRSSYTMASSLNPSIPATNESNMVVRGGSWKDIGYMLMVSTRDYEHKDSARSFVGFRTVQPFPDGSRVVYRTPKK